MGKLFKENFKVLVAIIITFLITVTGTVFAVDKIHARDVSFKPTNESFQVDDVNDALDFLYENKESGGYVGLFSGSSSISTSEKNLPVIYLNDKYATRDGDTITFTYPGTYQVIATASHSPQQNEWTSWINVYLDGKILLDDDNAYNLSSANNYYTYNILDKEIVVEENSSLSVTLASDRSLSGVSGGTVAIIKK